MQAGTTGVYPVILIFLNQILNSILYSECTLDALRIWVR